jgi:hypothetical protein
VLKVDVKPLGILCQSSFEIIEEFQHHIACNAAGAFGLHIRSATACSPAARQLAHLLHRDFILEAVRIEWIHSSLCRHGPRKLQRISRDKRARVEESLWIGVMVPNALETGFGEINGDVERELLPQEQNLSRQGCLGLGH